MQDWVLRSGINEELCNDIREGNFEVDNRFGDENIFSRFGRFKVGSMIKCIDDNEDGYTAFKFGECYRLKEIFIDKEGATPFFRVEGVTGRRAGECFIPLKSMELDRRLIKKEI